MKGHPKIGVRPPQNWGKGFNPLIALTRQVWNSSMSLSSKVRFSDYDIDVGDFDDDIDFEDVDDVDDDIDVDDVDDDISRWSSNA